MSEDETEPLDDHLTSPAPFEEYVKNQFEVVLARLDGVESGLRAEMVERFLQVSRQIRDVDERVQDLGEQMRDLDEKVDTFIKEQLRLKRELREVQESLTPKS